MPLDPADPVAQEWHLIILSPKRRGLDLADLLVRSCCELLFPNFPELRSVHGQNAILLLTILVQYRKYETANPYGVKLSILDQEMSLHGYGQVLTELKPYYS